MNWRLINVGVLGLLALVLLAFAAQSLMAGHKLDAGLLAGIGAAIAMRGVWQGAILAGAKPRTVYILAVISVLAVWAAIIAGAAWLLVGAVLLDRQGQYAAAIALALAIAVVLLARRFLMTRSGRKGPAAK